MYTKKSENVKSVKLHLKERFREGEIKFLKDLVTDGALTIEKAAKKIGISPDEFSAL